MADYSTRLDAETRAALPALLSQVVGNLSGIVDTGTSLCIALDERRAEEFIVSLSEGPRAALTVLRLYVGQLPDARPHIPLVEQTSGDCERVLTAAAVLARFRSAPLEQILAAARDMEQGYAGALRDVRELQRALNCPAAELDCMSSERESFYRRILSGLFELFRAEKETAARPAV